MLAKNPKPWVPTKIEGLLGSFRPISVVSCSLLTLCSPQGMWREFARGTEDREYAGRPLRLAADSESLSSLSLRPEFSAL